MSEQRPKILYPPGWFVMTNDFVLKPIYDKDGNYAGDQFVHTVTGKTTFRNIVFPDDPDEPLVVKVA